MKQICKIFLALGLLAFASGAHAQGVNRTCQQTVNPVTGSNNCQDVGESAPFNVVMGGGAGFGLSGSGSATGTSATTIIAAPATNRIYVTGIQCGRTDAGTTAAYVTLNDAASTIVVLPNSGGGGGNNQVYLTPLTVAATTALQFTASGSISTIYCNAQGYNAP